MAAKLITSHPHYAEGYWDACENVSIFEDATPEYRAGWEAAMAAKEVLLNAGLQQTSPGQFSKTTALSQHQGGTDG